MKRIRSGVTLVELIISAMIVSMVIAGVFSAEYALRRISESGATNVVTNINVKAVAEAVRASARRLHGDPTTDTGFYFSAHTLCFRHEDVSGGFITPEKYSDDVNTCYTLIGTDMHTCEHAPDPSPCVISDTVVGQLVSDQFDGASIPLPDVVADPVTGEFYFEMTLVGRKDPAAGVACSPCGIGATLTGGTADNPQVVINIRENAAGF